MPTATASSFRTNLARGFLSSIVACVVSGCPAATPAPATCPAGLTMCGDRCADTTLDPANCGACGTACGTGQACRNSACGTSCPPGFVLCGTSCVDPSASASHCGASGDCSGANAGTACTAGTVCSLGTCAVVCPPGFVACNGGCVDPQSNSRFCGASGTCTGSAAGTACGVGTVCAWGSCSTVCPAGQIACGASCVDPNESRLFCGASGSCTGGSAGAVCGAGQACVSGTCAVMCPPPFVLCDGSCVDPSASSRFCGASGTCTGGTRGTTCGAGTVCIANQCTSTDATLSGLTVSAGALSPAFSPGTSLYVVTVGAGTLSVSVTPTVAVAGGTVTVNGVAVSSGAASAPVALAMGAPTSVAVRVTASNGATRDYSVVVVRGTIGYLKASNTRTGAIFGVALALSDDTLVVGAPGESSAATGVNGDQTSTSAGGSGAVYVYTRSGSAWVQQANLKASNSNAFDNFGASVAFSGDTLVVGAPYERSKATGINGNQADNTAAGAGAVYVFVRSSGSWSQQAYVKASNTDANDNFGTSVALSGDTLIVGAPEERSTATGINGNQGDNSAASIGAAYVFVRGGTTWTQQAYLKSSNITSTGGYFGWAVAVDGDTAAVGAFLEASNATGVNGNQLNTSASASGAVYVFTRSGTVWAQEAYVKASNAEAMDEFGVAVALLGNTLAVTALGEDSSAGGVNGNQFDNTANNSGAVYVFQKSGGIWAQQAYLKAPVPDASGQFGRSVGLAGNHLVVGAPQDMGDGAGVNGMCSTVRNTPFGGAFAYERSAGAWTYRAALRQPYPEANEEFGRCVALSPSGAVMAVGNPSDASAATGFGGNPVDVSMGGSGAVWMY